MLKWSNVRVHSYHARVQTNVLLWTSKLGSNNSCTRLSVRIDGEWRSARWRRNFSWKISESCLPQKRSRALNDDARQHKLSAVPIAIGVLLKLHESNANNNFSLQKSPRPIARINRKFSSYVFYYKVPCRRDVLVVLLDCDSCSSCRRRIIYRNALITLLLL